MIFRGELASQRSRPGLGLADFILPFIKSPEWRRGKTSCQLVTYLLEL